MSSVLPSSEIQSAVHVDRLRRDVGRRIARQEHDGIGDFLRETQDV